MSSDKSLAQSTQMTQSSSYSSSSSSSFSSSKTVKTTSTVKSMSVKSSSSSSSVSIRSAGSRFADTRSKELGYDVDNKMKELTDKMDREMDDVKREFFRMTSLESLESADKIVKLDNSSLSKYIDDTNKDKLKFNFDVDEFESESISVKAVGNQVEVHAKKKSRKDGQETSEEFTKAYELPTTEDIDPAKVTSSFYKDGVLTVELPVEAAITEKKE